MEPVKVGELITGDARRDAIHMAIAPVVAGENLSPGEHINIMSDGTAMGAFGDFETIGIVDPFLTRSVEKGHRFYLWLYPQTVTSLRHEWTHPAFPDIDDETAKKNMEIVAGVHKKWLKDFAREVNVTYETLMEAARNFIETGDYYCLSDDTPQRVFDESSEFWTHYDAIAGKSGKSDEIFFRCAC